MCFAIGITRPLNLRKGKEMRANKNSFLHDSDARNDEKMLELRAQHGSAGYGIFWMLIELMREATGYKLSRDRIGAISIGICESRDLVAEIINTAIDVGLFVEEAGHFFAPSLVRRLESFDAARQRRQEGWKKRKSASSAGHDDESSMNHDDFIMTPGEVSLSPPCCDVFYTNTNTKTKINTKILGGECEGGDRVTLAPRVVITSDDVEKLKNEFGPEAVQHYAQICSDWLISNGKTKKNYASFMRMWIRKDIAECKGFYHPSQRQNGYATFQTKQQASLERSYQIALAAEAKKNEN